MKYFHQNPNQYINILKMVSIIYNEYIIQFRKRGCSINGCNTGQKDTSRVEDNC